MKKKLHLVLLAVGIVCLAIGVFFFGRICAVKDSIYANYKLSFSDASFESVFVNDHDEAAVKADFDAAVLATAQSGGEEAEAPPRAKPRRRKRSRRPRRRSSRRRVRPMTPSSAAFPGSPACAPPGTCSAGSCWPASCCAWRRR